MTAQVEGPAPPGNRPEDQATTKPLDESSLSNLPGYAVIVVAGHGTPRRRVYLDLADARAGVGRAHDNANKPG